jgi:hypothetical protein
MSGRTRPRAPWYAPATRRLGVLRVGSVTLLACVFAMGPAMAASAPVHDLAAVVARTTHRAMSVLEGHSHGDGEGNGTDPHGDGR